MIKQNQYYFIPGYHKLIYCHNVKGDVGIFGGMAKFWNDSRTSCTRQSMTTEEFKKLKPKELDPAKLNQYPFIKAHDFFGIKCWGVTDVVQHKKDTFYAKVSCKLPSLVLVA